MQLVQICQTCGHDKDKHGETILQWCSGDHWTCECERFVPPPTRFPEGAEL